MKKIGICRGKNLYGEIQNGVVVACQIREPEIIKDISLDEILDYCINGSGNEVKFLSPYKPTVEVRGNIIDYLIREVKA